MRVRLKVLWAASEVPRMLCWAVLTGIGGAVVTIAFHHGIHIIQLIFSGDSGSIVQVTRGLPWYGRLLIPALGGGLAGMMLWAAHRIHAGTSSDYMEAVAIGDGRLSVRQGVLRSLSSLCTVATGGSIGREGAMVHLASLWASVLGRFTGFGTARLRLLVACGAAAGVSAAYGAPIAGAVFIGEIVLGTMAIQSFGPLLVSAAVANIVMRVSGYYETPYAMPDLGAVATGELLLCVLLGVLAGVGAPQFLRIINGVKSLFARTALPLPWRMALGGLLLGAVLMLIPEVAGNGYSVVFSLLHVSWAWHAVLLILVCKVLATALTVGSGAVGGVFTPTIFVGAAFGTLFAQVLMVFWPGLAAQVPVFTLVGMGAFLAAATSAPFMAILMIFEMTLSYQIVLPLVLACVPAYFVSRGLAQAVMYDVTLARERDLALQQRLRTSTVAALVRPAETVVYTRTPVREALQMFLDYPVKYLYVVDERECWQGVIAQQDLTRMLLSEGDVEGRQCSEVLRLDFVKPLHPDLSLDVAQAQFVSFQGERLPVVSRDLPPRLLGVVYKSSLLEQYSMLKKSLDSQNELMLAPRQRP